jgi:hypothetical protein
MMTTAPTNQMMLFMIPTPSPGVERTMHPRDAEADRALTSMGKQRAGHDSKRRRR